jgi:hypothetical protein
MLAAGVILQNAEEEIDLPDNLATWTINLVSLASCLAVEAYKLYALPLMASVISRLGNHESRVTHRANANRIALIRAIDHGITDLNAHVELLPLCLDLLGKVKTALEKGWFNWEISTVKAWSSAFKPLLASEDLQYKRPCQEFWHICHDKLGLDCFPEDQVDIITESLGLADQAEDDEAKVDISFDLMAAAVSFQHKQSGELSTGRSRLCVMIGRW